MNYCFFIYWKKREKLERVTVIVLYGAYGEQWLLKSIDDSSLGPKDNIADKWFQWCLAGGFVHWFGYCLRFFNAVDSTGFPFLRFPTFLTFFSLGFRWTLPDTWLQCGQTSGIQGTVLYDENIFPENDWFYHTWSIREKFPPLF